MPRDFQALIEIARHAAGGTLDPRLDADAIVNDAGEHVVSMHEWTFLKRPAVPVDLVAGQPFINLPADASHVDSIWPSSALLATVTMSSLDRINEVRSLDYIELLHYYVAPEWPSQNDESSAPGIMRLAVAPTPSESNVGAFHIAYTAGWRHLTQKNARHCLPADMEPLLIQVIREMTLGILKQNDETLPRAGRSAVDRLEAISQSTMFMQLKVKYGQKLGNVGQARGGVIESTRGRRVTRSFSSITFSTD